MSLAAVLLQLGKGVVNCPDSGSTLRSEVYPDFSQQCLKHIDDDIWPVVHDEVAAVLNDDLSTLAGEEDEVSLLLGTERIEKGGIPAGRPLAFGVSGQHHQRHVGPAPL